MDSPELRARLQAGDPTAFDEVYTRFRPGLFRYLTRLCQDRALAEELLQEVWLRFADHAHALPTHLELGAWLFTVGRNLYRSQRRRQRLSSRWLQAFTQGIQVAPTPSSPFDLLSASRAQHALETALAELPERYREVVILVAVEQLTPSQAAQIMGIQPEAARQRLSRARRLLTQILERNSAACAVRETT